MNKKEKYIKNHTREMLDKVKNAILSIEPDAEIYLFGSRARGDNNIDSDWDFLILITGEAKYERKKNIIHILFDIELEYEYIFNTIIYSKDHWYNNSVFQEHPFNQNVSNDRISI